jgi:hypothetical protein
LSQPARGAAGTRARGTVPERVGEGERRRGCCARAGGLSLGIGAGTNEDFNRRVGV